MPGILPERDTDKPGTIKLDDERLLEGTVHMKGQEKIIIFIDEDTDEEAFAEVKQGEGENPDGPEDERI